MQSNTIFNIKQTIPISAGVGYEFEISWDFELGEPIELPIAESIVLKNLAGTQIERLEITATNGMATIVKRWLNQENTATEDVNLQKQWNDGDIWYITQLAFDLLDITWDNTLSGNNTFAWDNTFTWDNTFEDIIINNSIRIPVFANEIARDAGIPSPLNGMSIYLTSIGQFQDYAAWVWNIRESAWTDRLVAVSGTDTTPGQLDGKITNGDGISKVIVDPTSNESLLIQVDTSDTSIHADEVEFGLVKKATSAEALAWVENSKYLTAKDAYVVLNGTITRETATIWSLSGIVTSSWLLLNNRSIAKYVFTAWNSFTGTWEARIEISTDGITWSTLYSAVLSSSWEENTAIFMTQPWLYYRAYVNKQFWGGSNLTAQLQFSI